MSPTAKCGQVRGWMTDAASGSLSDARRGEFEKHVGDCAACHAEFQRVESLLGRIDQNLRAALAVEPSQQLLANVRQSIAAEPQRSRSWLGSNRRFAAVACAACAAVLLEVTALHRGNEPSRHYVAHTPVVNSVPARVSPPSRRSASAESIPPGATARSHSNKPRIAVAHQEFPRNTRLHNSEPEVIVQPGQMQAILQFVAETRSGKINGAQIEEGIKAAEKPLEIKPLNIAPLETSQGDTNEDPTAKSRAPGSADGRSE